MGESKPNRLILIATIGIILACLVGGALGLLISRAVQLPSGSSDDFAALGVATKEEYIILVGIAYTRDHDVEKARAKLALLEAPNVNLWISNLIDGYESGEWDEHQVRALMELAYGLGVDNQRVLAYMATLTPAATHTPYPTPTLAPTNTPLPAPTNTMIPPSPTSQPTDTPPPQPTDTPVPVPTDTAIPASPTTAPTNTPQPQPPTNTPKPQPTAVPTNTPPSWVKAVSGM